MLRMTFLTCALATSALLISSTGTVEATDFMDGVVPESTFVETEVLNSPTSADALRDFKKDGLDGGMQDLAKQAGSKVSHQKTRLSQTVQRLAAELPEGSVSMDDLPSHLCDGRHIRKGAAPPNSAVLDALKLILDAYDSKLDLLCTDPKKNSVQIRKATREFEGQVKTVNLSKVTSAEKLSDEDLAAIGHIDQIPDPAETQIFDDAMDKYCKHGSYAGEIKNLHKEPVLDKLEEGVREFDKCMSCVCKHGKDECLSRPTCLAAMGKLGDVGGDLAKAKGFLDKNGNLIQELGPKHAQAIHKVVNHVAKKKHLLHARYGAEPTKEQFLEIFSTNDLSEQTLVQVQGCHGMSAATAVEFRSGAISCGFDCNEYNGGEASLSCSAFEVVTVEIGVTFQPLTMYVKLKLCAPGVSDVIGEIQKIPVVDAILSKFGLDGGCLLLGKGYIDFTNGIGEILPGNNGVISFSMLIAKAELEAKAFFRFDSALPNSNPWEQDCHKHLFRSGIEDSFSKTLYSICQGMVSVLGNELKPKLPAHPQCRDYATCPEHPSVYANRGTFGLSVPQPEDWFGIRAGVDLKVFCPCGWPWKWGYKSVFSKVFYKNTWKTGNY